MLLTSLMRPPALPATGLLADPPKKPLPGLLGPRWDPIVHDPAVQQAFLQELALSRNGERRAERRGLLFQKEADGSYFVHPLDNTGSTAGKVAGSGLWDVPAIPGARFLGDYHTHPSAAGDVIPDATLPKGQVRQVARDPDAGGGSPGDWLYADARGRSHYVVTHDPKGGAVIYRLDPNTLEDNRGRNPNRWTLPPK